MTTVNRMWVLDAPTLTIPMSNMVNGAKGTIAIPSPAYLVEHERGLALFDTSLPPAASDDPYAVFGEAADDFRLDYPESKKLVNQLGALGFETSDVTHVVTSHAHFDHVGGLHLFPEARHYIGADEIRWAFWPDSPGKEHFSGAAFEPLRDADWTYIPQHVDHDLFADGSVTILSTPGHTIGELSLLVKLPTRNFILTGDALHLRESFTDEAPGPVDYNSRMAIEAIRRLGRLKEAHDATFHISHDLEDYAEFGHAPDFLR